MIERIFAHAEATDAPLHAFMQKHCAHLLAPGPDTGVGVAALEPSGLVEGPVQLPPRFSRALVGDAKFDSGVYSLFNPSTGSRYYGSCLYEGNRLDLHYHEYHKALEAYQSSAAVETHSSVSADSGSSSVAEGASSPQGVSSLTDKDQGKRLYRVMIEEGGIEAFQWGVVHETPNYWQLYLTERPELGGNGPVRRMLEELAAYERRMIELSIIDYANPSLNSSGVTFTSTWVPGAAGPATQATPVIVSFEPQAGFDHPPLHLPSKKAAAMALDVDRTTIDAALGEQGRLIWSNALKVRASVAYDTVAAAAAEAEADVALSDLPFVLEELPLDVVKVYNKDWELVGEAPSAQACLEDYQVSGYFVRKYINRRFILGAVSGVSSLLFFARNPHKGRWNPVLQTNVVTGLTTEHSGVFSCVKAVTGKSPSGSFRAAFIKRYIEEGAVLGGTYTFRYKHPKS